ncbi:hypothetical protein OOT46_15530 [Aquabacterium sp. A7-Y]|uniref:hypothetical protein n=1 Tax=Aquabacterium sp. A7-Y TaxID=1349605 RepID=UPI00223DD76C|nr:hypothetical protein [Aquabacterium sp. A7-Y]MCW7539255.1 hypothetical protein [Aquabacterium sp. A7-Y]
MKKTDLEKSKGSKIAGQMKQAGVPGRFGAAAAALPDRREQRRLDQARGLVPFAVKLHSDLVKQLHERAAARGGDLNELVAELLKKGLEQTP